MALQNLTSDAAGTRLFQALGGADTLVADQPVSTASLAALGPLLAEVDAGTESENQGNQGTPGVTSAAQPVFDAANETVLSLHYLMEGTADRTGTGGAVHGLTHLGEAVGPGYIGDDAKPNTATDVLNVVDTVAVGSDPVVQLANIASQVGHAIVPDAGGLVGGAGSGTTLGGGLGLDVANGIVRDTADPLTGGTSTIGSGFGLPTNAVGDLASAVGIGTYGETRPDGGTNILTAVATAPGNVLAGQDLDDVLAPILTATGNVLGSGNPLAGIVGGTIGDGVGLAPIEGALNGAALGLDGALEGVGANAGVLAAIPHATSDLISQVGLGYLGTSGPDGDSNLVTSALDLPKSVLDGGDIKHGLDPVIANTAETIHEAGNVLASVVDAVNPTIITANGNTLYGITDALGHVTGVDSDGPYAALGVVQPVLETVSGALGEHGGGGDGPGAPLENVVGTVQGALPDVLTLSGNTGGGADPALNVVQPVLGTVSSALGEHGGGGDGPLAPLENVVGTLHGGLPDVLPTSGNTGGGTQPLVAISVGPEGVAGPEINVLSGGTVEQHPLELNVLDLHQAVLPPLALADHDQLSFPNLGGQGTDALHGALSDSAPLATALPTSAADSVPLHLDLGVVDLGDHSAPQPHETSTSSLPLHALHGIGI